MRTSHLLVKELSRLKYVEMFWKDRRAIDIRPIHLASYHTWRKRQMTRKNAHGGRSVDLDIMTLNNVLGYAVRAGRLESNPLAGSKPKFASKTVRHCREVMPADGDTIHTLAANLFDDPRSEALGWQLLLQAMTGCRTHEILALRWDAASRQPGCIEGEWLWVPRGKGGVNPFVLIHDTLGACLDKLKTWHLDRDPLNPWFIPGQVGKPMGISSLGHALKRICPLLKIPPVTPHGLRAYYVTVRRSQGISDAQIAAAIGDKTGASMIVTTYGAIPPNWAGSAPKLGWNPSEDNLPAWELLDLPDNVVSLSPEGKETYEKRAGEDVRGS
jgi:integrase